LAPLFLAAATKMVVVQWMPLPLLMGQQLERRWIGVMKFSSMIFGTT